MSFVSNIRGHRWLRLGCYGLIIILLNCTALSESRAQGDPITGLTMSVDSNSNNNALNAFYIGDPATSNITVTSGPIHGTLTFSDFVFLYTPTPGYMGMDAFTYTFNNADGFPVAVTVSITVLGEGPTLESTVNEVYSDSQANQINLLVSSNSTSLSIQSGPQNGIAQIKGKSLIYTPNKAFIGRDIIMLVASNFSGNSEAVPIYINVISAPLTANPLSISVEANSQANLIQTQISAAASDIEIVTPPQHGNATISGKAILFTPSSGYSGSDSITYIAKNANSRSTPALISINIKPLPLPIANPINAEVMANSNANSIAASVTGKFVQLSISKMPIHGTVSVNGQNFIYTPNKDFSGDDSFSYIATNASGKSNEAIASLIIKQIAPVAQPGELTLNVNDGVSIIRPIISGAVDNLRIITPASHGTASVSGLEIRYTPTLNFIGTDSFSYVATNSAGSSAPVTVTVVIKAKPPEIRNANLVVLAGNTVSLDLSSLVSNTAGAATTFQIISQPAHGIAVLNDSRLTIRADLNYAGVDQMRVMVNANGLNSAPALIGITVTARPDPTQDKAIQALQVAKAAVINQFERLQLENFNSRLHEISSQYSALRNETEKKKQADECGRLSLWVSGLNSFSSIASDYAIKQSNGGMSIGGDRCVGNPETVLGFGLGYASNRGELPGLATTMVANARNISQYGQLSPFPAWHFSWVIGVNDIQSDYTRIANVTNSSSGLSGPPNEIWRAAPNNSQQHTGKWSGKQKMGSTSVGFDINFTQFKISPYLRLDRSVMTIGAYSETGNASSGLAYQAQSFDSRRTTLGANTETLIKTSWGELTPRLRLEYQRDLGKHDDTRMNYLDNLDSPAYIIKGSELDRRLFHMGIGGDLLLESGWVVILNYGYYRSNEGNHSNAFRVRLSYRL
ncbi:autotransporter family protein [Undibacterium fentianense]|uniref:Tandem-95 repeat protein n=1 Tax=Undibacterium fentianense TaxID=2828728 RepID=A0A941E4M2_9BURK|nr:Ig-like domain-containing protein [Undibacterium fentianense]MBR7801456.1 tandem-95 repeat protein [Undibacterium fentianense]